MQTIFNVKTPFLNSDGAVIRAGRAWFVTLDTGSDCISITDADGAELANPLAIGSDGYFETQPFAPDGTDFHVIVQEYLGTAAEYEDDDNNYSTVYEWDVIHPALDVSLEGLPQVDSLSDLAECQGYGTNADGYVGAAVLVLGYSTATDFCPPRVFKWGSYAGDEANGNTIVNISSSIMGSWYLSFSLEQDIRWWGVDPSDSTTDWYSRISAGCSYAIDEDITTYFPPGEYLLSQSVKLGKVRTDGAKFTPYDTATDNVRVTISNGEPVEDVSFGISDAGVVCYPIVYHTLRTSWLIYDPQLAFAASELVLLLPHNIFFDRIYGDGSTEEVSISHKHVIVKVGLAFPMTCEGCTVEFVSNGSSVPELTATSKPAYKFTDCSLSGDVTCEGIVVLTNCGTLPIGFFSDDPTNYKKMLYASSGTTFYVAEDVDLSGDDGYSETEAGFEFAYGVVLSCTDDEGLLLKSPTAYKHSWKNLGEGVKIPEGETSHINWFDTTQHWLECGSTFYDGDGETIDDDGLTTFLSLTDARVTNLYLTSTYMSSIPSGVHCDGCVFADMTDSLEVSYKAETKQNMGVAYVATDDETVTSDMDHTVISPGGLVTTGIVQAACLMPPTAQTFYVTENIDTYSGWGIEEYDGYILDEWAADYDSDNEHDSTIYRHRRSLKPTSNTLYCCNCNIASTANSGTFLSQEASKLITGTKVSFVFDSYPTDDGNEYDCLRFTYLDAAGNAAYHMTHGYGVVEFLYLGGYKFIPITPESHTYFFYNEDE